LDLGFFGSSRGKEAGGEPDGFLTSVASERPAASFILTEHVLRPLRAARPAHTDKRTFGHLFVVSGSRTMPGAVMMAVESALVSGVGLVTAFVPESLAASFAARLPEAMWVPMPETLEGGLALEGRGSVVARAARCTGLLAGPGLGRDRESLALIAELLRAIDVPAVLDGDALHAEIIAAHYPGSAPVRVLTPHAGEYARIAGDDALPAAAQRLGATIALKGPVTRVCDVGVEYFSTFGGPVLSRGGSGDVLAGLIAGQLAQGASPLEAATRGVVWHGMAADRLARVQGQTSARVTQLVPQLAAVLQQGTQDG
jgi:NAD(P)H-hydrate epimerase